MGKRRKRKKRFQQRLPVFPFTSLPPRREYGSKTRVSEMKTGHSERKDEAHLAAVSRRAASTSRLRVLRARATGHDPIPIISVSQLLIQLSDSFHRDGDHLEQGRDESRGQLESSSTRRQSQRERDFCQTYLCRIQISDRESHPPTSKLLYHRILEDQSPPYLHPELLDVLLSDRRKEDDHRWSV